MSIITLDFETFFRSAKNKGTPGEAYTLKKMTYEEYIRSPLFKVHGVGIKIDGGETVYHYKNVEEVLKSIFVPNNTHALICHNTAFDGAILSWYYGLHAAVYWDTQGMSKALWAQCSAALDQLAKRLYPHDKTKRKGKELSSFDGVRDLTDAQQEIMGGYCKNDVSLTFDCFAAMYPYYPNTELELIDLTLQMFIHPVLILNREMVQDYSQRLLLDKEQKVKASGVAKTVLSSNKRFEQYLEAVYDIIVPSKPSKTNPEKWTQALAANDLEFLQLQAEHPELKHIWDARIATKSMGELTRCTRVLSHAQKSHINEHGAIAVPLAYCAAHTKRFGGTNKVNFQNFKRNSPLRHALTAPEGHVICVRDLSAIEGRMNAWFNDQTDKLERYARKEDEYNTLATSIYGYKVDRKLPVTNEQGQYLNAAGEVVAKKDDAAKVFDLEGRVGKIAELGLGYQMGAKTFLKQLLLAGVMTDLDFAKRVVTTWRGKNNAIAAGWKLMETVIYDMARKDLEPYQLKCITVEKERLKLPGGLYLTYPGLVMREDSSGRWFEYWEGKFMKKLYGGLLMENIIQAISRMVMTEMMLNIARRIKQYGGRIALNVHDEIVAVCPEVHADVVLQIMDEEMSRVPAWCRDGSLVLTSEGGYARTYSK